MSVYAPPTHAAGDKQKFDDLFDLYYKQMIFIALGILKNEQDAEDAIQNALFGISKHMEAVPLDNPKLTKAYVFTAARNAAISLHRKQAREVETAPMDDFPLSIDVDPMAALMQIEDYDLLVSLLSELPLAQREILFLRYVQGRNVKETAKLLDRTANYIQVQTFRAKKHLAELCRKEGIEIE